PARLQAAAPLWQEETVLLSERSRSAIKRSYFAMARWTARCQPGELRSELYQRTSVEYFSTSSTTSRTSAKSAIRTSTPLSACGKIARLGLVLRSLSSSVALARESRGKGCMMTVLGSQY